MCTENLSSVDTNQDRHGQLIDTWNIYKSNIKKHLLFEKNKFLKQTIFSKNRILIVSLAYPILLSLNLKNYQSPIYTYIYTENLPFEIYSNCQQIKIKKNKINLWTFTFTFFNLFRYIIISRKINSREKNWYETVLPSFIVSIIDLTHNLHRSQFNKLPSSEYE